MAITMASLNSLSLLPQSQLIPLKHNLHYPRSLSLSSSSVIAKAFSDVATTAVGEDLPLNYDEYLPNASASDGRRAGILLHPTSLPGPHGIGDLGEQAFRFIDWLHSSGCSLWQVLPLVPPGRKANEEGSPYSGQDANCGNTLLISLEELVKDGLLYDEELPEPINAERVNYDTIAQIKDPLVAKILLGAHFLGCCCKISLVRDGGRGRQTSRLNVHIQGRCKEKDRGYVCVVAEAACNK